MPSKSISIGAPGATVPPAGNNEIVPVSSEAMREQAAIVNARPSPLETLPEKIDNDALRAHHSQIRGGR